MNRIHSHAAVLSAFAVAFAAFSSAAGPQDPVVGTWAGSMVSVMDTTPGTGPEQTTAAEWDCTIVYSANHTAIYTDTNPFPGSWKSKNGRYKVDISDPYIVMFEGQLPGAKVDGFAKFKNVDVIGTAQFGDFKAKLTAKQNGTTGKIATIGAIALELP